MTIPLKFLVLLDGSPRSMRTLDYIAAVRPLRKAHLVLYQVVSEVPEYYWDMVAETGSAQGIQEMERWRREAQQQSEAFMEDARKFLVAAGFHQETIEIKLHNRVVGIARDILEEAKRGYDGVIMRRRGRGGDIKGVVVGSVANKLLSRLPNITIVLAGIRNQNKKVLMAVDGPVAANRAVDMVAAMLGGYDYRIELVHVVRRGESPGSDGAGGMPTNMAELFTNDVQNRLQELRERLLRSGFAETHVSEKILSDVESRAEAIVAEAETQDCSTIVMGRKGPAGPEDIVTGSVCSKVIHRGREFTVWIV